MEENIQWASMLMFPVEPKTWDVLYSKAATEWKMDIQQVITELLSSEAGREEFVEALVEAMSDLEAVYLETTLQRMRRLIGSTYDDEAIKALLIEAAAKAGVPVLTEESPFWDADSLDGLQ